MLGPVWVPDMVCVRVCLLICISSCGPLEAIACAPNMLIPMTHIIAVSFFIAFIVFSPWINEIKLRNHWMIPAKNFK